MESQDRIFRNDTDKELLCIALHGDYKYGPLKNTETELDNQSDVLVKALSHEIEKINQSGRSAFYVPTDGFDKTMLNIAHMFFENEDLQRRIDEIKKNLGVGAECETTAFQPFTDEINKCMDTNLFPIKFPLMHKKIHIYLRMKHINLD